MFIRISCRSTFTTQNNDNNDNECDFLSSVVRRTCSGDRRPKSARASLTSGIDFVSDHEWFLRLLVLAISALGSGAFLSIGFLTASCGKVDRRLWLCNW